MNPRASPATLALNFLTFQAGWFACVLGAAHGRWRMATLAALAIVLGWLITTPRPVAFSLLLALTGVVGWCWDSWLVVMGLIAYAPGPLSPPLAPLWILALWLLLATTLPLSMRWLQERWLLAAAVGAIAAPLSYFAGARLGALTLVRMQPALWTLAIGWALLLPLLLRLAKRLDA